jgi:phosphate-selective porin OprO/OprP
MKFRNTWLAPVLAFSAFASGPVRTARADDAAEIAALREQIRLLDQKLRVLERKHELAEEAAAAAAPTTAKVTVSDRGDTLASPDGANSIRVRGLVQMDARFFGADGGIVNNAFVLRRARLITEGQFARNYSFQLLTEFGGSAVSIPDANFTVAINRGLQFKFGKFKSPVGHEQLQSDSFTLFNERSIATNLVPNRDVGIQASGELLDNTVAYQLGILNGLADGSNTTNTDFDNGKELVGRVMFTPFRSAAGSLLQGLTFGLSGSTARAKTAAGRSSGYRTDGQQTFFTYNAAVVSDGENWRISPQLDYRHGAFGLMSEYVSSTVNVRPSATGPRTELTNKAWQTTVAYVVTGEDSSYGGVVPKTNFDWSAGTWGALEFVARFADLKIDDTTFPLFASAAASASEAKSVGLGFNWYLSKPVVFKIDYYHTEFGLHATAPAIPTTPVIRQDEQAFISRFQLAF